MGDPIVGYHTSLNKNVRNGMICVFFSVFCVEFCEEHRQKACKQNKLPNTGIFHRGVQICERAPCLPAVLDQGVHIYASGFGSGGPNLL